MNKSIISEELGLYGWNSLEPVILAALATKLPLLLIGKHGSAKSFVLERMAEALHLEYRFYNASLINYDDLVGIPIPINNNTELSYISNKSSIWDAEVVFIDEINRTKLELQNKLFPIIYDKRIQGIDLTKLKYRWCAMNPINLDEDDDNYYLGVSPLDPALADRFPFIVNVPSWEELDNNDKLNMLKDTFSGKHNLTIDINEVIKKVEEKIDEIKEEEIDSINTYIINLVDLLNNVIGYISARRATMLLETLISIYASMLIIDSKTKLKDACILHILNTIPTTINKKIDKSVLLNICNQAIELSNLSSESIEKKMLLISDDTERIRFALKHKNDIDVKLLTDTLSKSLSNVNNPLRRGLSLITYLALRDKNDIYPSFMEIIVKEIKDVFNPIEITSMEVFSKAKIYNHIVVLMSRVQEEKYAKYLSNLLNSFLPDGYSSNDEVDKLYNTFISMYEELKL